MYWDVNSSTQTVLKGFSGIWSQGPYLNDARDFPSRGHLTEIADRWLIACGSDDSKYTDCEILDSHEATPVWRRIVANTSVCTWEAATVGFGDSWMIISGGDDRWDTVNGLTLHTCSDGNRCDTVHAYNIHTEKWTELPKLPYKIWLHSMVVLDGQVIICGGLISVNGNKTRSSSCLRLASMTGEWQSDIPDMYAEPHVGSALASVDGQLLTFGGVVRDADGLVKTALGNFTAASDVYAWRFGETSWRQLNNLNEVVNVLMTAVVTVPIAQFNQSLFSNYMIIWLFPTNSWYYRINMLLHFVIWHLL